MWIPLPLNSSSGAFLGGPAVKTLPSNAASSSGQGAKITHASWPKNQNVKLKQQCNKFHNDFKNDPCQRKFVKKKNRPIEVLLIYYQMYQFSLKELFYH